MLSAVASGSLAGAVAAVTAVAAVDQLVTRRGDQRLRGATDVLAGEIDEDTVESEWEPLGDIVADENSELVTSGVRLAVFSSGHRIAGDPWVPYEESGSCATFSGRGARACARSYRHWTLVAAAKSDDVAAHLIYLAAALAALALGALGGALASAVLTRSAVRPLTELSDAIRDLEPVDMSAERLGASSRYEEVELIREALVELLERSRALLAQSQRFAADAAHELRTPLTIIRAELELLLEETRAPSERVVLDQLGRRANKLEALVERLLVLASPLDRLGERGEPVSLAEVIAGVVANLPADQRERLRLDLRGEGLVRGDPALLDAMIANAIDNALKFSGDAPVHVALADVSSELESARQRAVRVDVRDEGPGIPPDQRERVFEAFFRGRPDAAPGHGLGLSLIAHVASAHRGTTAFVDVDHGACLRVTLPEWTAATALEQPLTRP